MAEPIMGGVKGCPGWEGNGFSCGRGQPRLIREEDAVCKNCSRGMRKRGQKTREEQERQAQRARDEEEQIHRGVVAVRRRVTTSGPALATLAGIIDAIEGLTQGDLAPPDKDPLSPSARWMVLRAVAGLPARDAS